MESSRINDEYIMGSIWGLIVGDALGVPVEFLSRMELDEKPVTTMLGFGTHMQPPGTWSDDSSMVIATLEWLNEQENMKKLDYHSLMDKFCNWLMYGDYTPYGENFDNGITISRALVNYSKGTEPIDSGDQSEFANGNGSLMRILPAILAKYKELCAFESEAVQFIYDMSSLTHRHARSKVACFIYASIIMEILKNDLSVSKIDVIRKALQSAKEYLNDRESNIEYKSEIVSYLRLFDVDNFFMIEKEQIKSSGYVVDTLEAAVWCFLRTDSYKECVLKAVNLGDDTDTVGAVAGGIAGVYYGFDAIPKDWIDMLPKKEWISELSTGLVKKYF